MQRIAMLLLVAFAATVSAGGPPRVRPNGGGGGGGGGGGDGVVCPADNSFTGDATIVANRARGPQAAPLRGNIGCVTDGLALRTDGQTATNIYGPFEAGFTSSVPGMSCLGSNSVPAGLDTQTAEWEVHHICGDKSITVLDYCGGHAQPYHYHERLSCLFTASAVSRHSTKIGVALDGNGIYGPSINGGTPPNDLDACGGRRGVTPDSDGKVVYYYVLRKEPPFTVGCFGPATMDECRELYAGCAETPLIVTTDFGRAEYNADCPCFNAAGSNVAVDIASGAAPAYYDPALITSPPMSLFCTQEVRPCDDGSSVGRDPAKNCDFKECPTVAPPAFCTEDARECDDGSFVGRDAANNCEFKECPILVIDCTQDVRRCDDGTFVRSDPSKNCEFKECPVLVVDCTQDVRRCDDVTFVRRDPTKKCEFQDCPVAPPVFCTQDVRRCEDGSFVSRDSANNCQFDACPTVAPPMFCTRDARLCDDGSSVGRDPENKCEFPDCPVAPPLFCTADARECDDGSSVGRDPAKNCDFKECPTVAPPAFCTEDARECDDGSFVGRDAANNCEFKKCPFLVIDCTQDVKICDDGSSVGRKSENKCEFDACPTQLTTGSVACPADVEECPDGSYVSRNAKRSCQFFPCTSERPRSCPADRLNCANDDAKLRVATANCAFEPCDDAVAGECAADAQMCGDGTFVARDPQHDCVFTTCRAFVPSLGDDINGGDYIRPPAARLFDTLDEWKEVLSTWIEERRADARNADIEDVADNNGNGCRKRDVRICSSGKVLAREQRRGCLLPRCDIGESWVDVCRADVTPCADGSVRMPDAALGCETPKCDDEKFFTSGADDDGDGDGGDGDGDDDFNGFGTDGRWCPRSVSRCGQNERVVTIAETVLNCEFNFCDTSADFVSSVIRDIFSGGRDSSGTSSGGGGGDPMRPSPFPTVGGGGGSGDGRGDGGGGGGGGGGNGSSTDGATTCDSFECPLNFVQGLTEMACGGACTIRDCCVPERTGTPPGAPPDGPTLGGAICTQEVRECDDGSFVGRDSANNCEFKKCGGDITSVDSGVVGGRPGSGGGNGDGVGSGVGGGGSPPSIPNVGGPIFASPNDGNNIGAVREPDASGNCDAGFFPVATEDTMAAASSIECRPCFPGTFAAAGDSVCTPCDAGTYAARFGAAECSACTPGRFAATRGSVRCLPCAAARVSNSGAAMCSACPEGMTAPKGQKECMPSESSVVLSASATDTSTAPDTVDEAPTLETVAPVESFVLFARGANAALQSSSSSSAGDGVTTTPGASTVVGISACPRDVRVCDDGSFVVRRGDNCVFEDCGSADAVAVDDEVTMAISAAGVALSEGTELQVSSVVAAAAAAETATAAAAATAAARGGKRFRRSDIKIRINHVDSDGNTRHGELKAGQFLATRVCNSTWTADTPVALFLELTADDADADADAPTFIDVVDQCNSISGQPFVARTGIDGNGACRTFPICHLSDFHLGFDEVGDGDDSVKIIFGIGISVAFLFLLAAQCWCLRRRYKRRAAERQAAVHSPRGSTAGGEGEAASSSTPPSAAIEATRRRASVDDSRDGGSRPVVETDVHLELVVTDVGGDEGGVLPKPTTPPQTFQV